MTGRIAFAAAVLALGAAGCASGGGALVEAAPPAPALPAGHVIAAGSRLPVGVPVVTFLDAGGFDARRASCWFQDRELPTSPAPGCDTPARYSSRSTADLAPATARRVAEQGWDLGALRERVDLFVFHYDAAITSTRCFRVLHDLRGLSAHFLLDLDGTLYQTLDLAARARHAGGANDRSIGIEIAHPGAYPDAGEAAGFYEERSGTRRLVADDYDPPPGGPFFPRHGRLFEATLNGSRVYQAGYTEAQYETLTRLVPYLSRHFPRLRREAPRDERGEVRRDALSGEELGAFQGFVGHHHVSPAKVDPGPAFDWSRVLPKRP